MLNRLKSTSIKKVSILLSIFILGGLAWAGILKYWARKEQFIYKTAISFTKVATKFSLLEQEEIAPQDL